jgi:Tol biopolymer transport system component
VSAKTGIGSRLGPYEITGKLGEGGMGEVYRATDSRLKREVAVKVLPPAFTADRERLARFEREAQTLASLSHPNIAAIFGLEESDGVRALVMELVDGEDLSTVIARGPLPLEEALPIARQMAEALEAAHERGIVHRDLKPANVKLTPDGAVKVLDFGLAKALEPVGVGVSAGDLAHSPTLTAAHGTQLGVVLGTAAYMSPEQAKGKAVDRRADIWSFGVVLFEMLTGRSLFEGETASEVLAAVIRQDVEWNRLPEVPAALRRLLGRCLERDPRLRLRDIGEARIALGSIDADGGSVEVPAAMTAQQALALDSKSALRTAALWALPALVAGLALGAAAVGLLRGRAGDRATPRVIRSVLPLPPGVAIELDGERAGMPALSHDGRQVAFGARQGAGPMRIWVQDLETGAARPLPGTEEGYRPFWSPDDRRVGFFTWSHLATTPAEGGPVSRLARARDARGGTWNREGTILFAPHQIGPLLAIPAGGGETRRVTSIAGGDRSGTHRFPQFLPDGEHFLYLARTSQAGPGSGAAVTLGRLGTLEPVARLVEAATNAVFADGHLLFARDGALMAQPFDPDQRSLGGEAKTIVGDLLFNLRFSFGVFSASDGELLAFLTGHQSDRSQLVWRDRAGRRLGELGAPGVLSGYGGIALSLDGRWAAVSRIEEGTSDADVWIYDLARGTETRLARPGVDDAYPIFAPDGNALYLNSRDGSSGSAIVRRDLTTGVAADLVASKEGDMLPMAVSPDGAWLLYDQGDGGNLGVHDLVLRPLHGGGELRQVAATPADDHHGQISPDGRWIAWSSDESGRYEIYVTTFAPGGSHVQVSRSGGVQPRWNPAGGELFFKTPDNMLTAVPVATAAGGFSVGEPVQLFPIVEFLGWTYEIAPDGERFLVREQLAEGDASPVTLLTNWTELVARR